MQLPRFLHQSSSNNKVCNSFHFEISFIEGFHKIDFRSWVFKWIFFQYEIDVMDYFVYIYFGYYEQINMYFNSIMLFLDGLFQFVDDDCNNPKMDVMTLVLSHQDKSTQNSTITIKCRNFIIYSKIPQKSGFHVYKPLEYYN